MLRYLHAQHVVCTNPAYEGSYSTVTLPVRGREAEGVTQAHVARLLHWVDGVVMSDVKTMSLETLQNAGSYAARMDKVLATFESPGAHRTHVWDLQNMADVADFTFAIQDQQLKVHTYFVSLALPVFSLFKTFCKCSLPAPFFKHVMCVIF